jgi:small GTP-binding protein
MSNYNIDNKVEVLFLGDERSGKTSIIYKYKHERLPSLHVTIGVELYTDNFIIGDNRQSVRFWDSAGNKNYRCLIKHYIKPSTKLYVIVFDVTNPKSYDNINNWLNELNINNIQNPDVIIVGNKVDLLKDNKYIEKYKPEKYPIIFVSAKEGDNIKYLFKRIHTRIVEKKYSSFNYLPYLNTPIIIYPHIKPTCFNKFKSMIRSITCNFKCKKDKNYNMYPL